MHTPHHPKKVQAQAKAQAAPAHQADTPGLAATSRLSAVLVAGILGAVLLYGVALSPAAHGVAHDTRHAIGFPCH